MMTSKGCLIEIYWEKCLGKTFCLLASRKELAGNAKKKNNNTISAQRINNAEYAMNLQPPRY